ncbi:YolD-like family protein [Cytobacillus oceanisediminis]|uniref:YolD-like family protein n=1 Tax=Cytobacillus oceanisediminis TaxID=665099 RepID=UPI003D71069F
MGVKMPKKSKPQRPSRDDFELEELGNQLVEAHNEKTEVTLIVFKKEEQVQGKIVKLDGQTKLIHVESGYETIKIPFLDILKVESAPQL